MIVAPAAALPAVFIASGRDELSAFPQDVKDTMGQAIYLAQIGGKHVSAKPLRGSAFKGAGTLEIVEDFDGDTYRTVYHLKLSGVVYVLHASRRSRRRVLRHPNTKSISSRAGSRWREIITRRPAANRRSERKRKASPMSDTRVTPSSGNIFADIGLPNPEEHLVKAQIVAVIDAFIRQSKLTQSEAAKRMGIAQSDLSKMLKGKFRGFSLERLFGFLLVLGYDVDVAIKKPANENQGSGRIQLACV